MIPASVVDKARTALLSALEQLDKAEQELGQEPERIDLVVVYSMGFEEPDLAWHEIAGWAATPGPKWVHSKMLERCSEALDDAAMAVDYEDEEQDDE